MIFVFKDDVDDHYDDDDDGDGDGVGMVRTAMMATMVMH